MSHNITLTSVVIQDLAFLEKAIRNINVPGVTLDRQAKVFRTYRGQDPSCDGAVKLPGQYDIGLKRTPNGNFNMVADFTMMDDTLMIPEVKGRDYSAKARIGLLTREVGLVQAEYEAAKRGMNARRVKGENGVISLRCTVR